MKRRSFVQGGLGLLTVSLLSTTAFGQDKKAISWWYESASPENQQSLQTLLVEPFNTAHADEELSIDFRGADLDKQLRVAMLSGSGPDIVYTPGPSYVASMAQAGQLLTHMEGVDPRRGLLVGDFNLTPWSFALRRIDAQLSLSRRSHGVASWPHRLPALGGAWCPAPFLPIDQIYAGSVWKVASIQRGPGTGSDHFGLIAHLVYQP